jgi:arylsulfatase A-like enzyme
MRYLSLLPFLPFLYGWGAWQVPIGPSERPKRKPNIVFILTDDQDLHMNSLDYTPLTRKYLLDEGTFFKHHYCTVALCCPSRVSLWTGKAAHNTNVTDVNVPYGSSKFLKYLLA